MWQCCCAASAASTGAAAPPAASPSATASAGTAADGDGGGIAEGAVADGGAPATVHSLTTDEVVTALTGLATFAGKSDAVPAYERLVMPRVRVDVSTQVAQGLLHAYRMMHEALLAPENGFEAEGNVVKPPEQVAALLGVEGEEGAHSIV